METKEFERLARLEQKQTDAIDQMDKHVAEDHRMLGEIRGNIKDIYEKLTTLTVGQAETRTAFKIIGAVIVILTPLMTALVVVVIEYFLKIAK